MSTETQPAPDTQKQLRVWIVLFFDGLDSMSHLHAFTYDSDMSAIEQWAKNKIAADKAVFSKNPENKSLPQRYVVYGANVDTLHVLRTVNTLRADRR